MPASILGIFILVLVHKITKCRILKERATALLGFWFPESFCVGSDRFRNSKTNIANNRRWLLPWYRWTVKVHIYSIASLTTSVQFTKSILQSASAILVRFVLHFTLFIRLLFLLQAHLAYYSVCVSAYKSLPCFNV